MSAEPAQPPLFPDEQAVEKERQQRERERRFAHAIVSRQRQREYRRWREVQDKRRNNGASVSARDVSQPADPHNVREITKHLPPDMSATVLAALDVGELLAFPHVGVAGQGALDGERDYYALDGDRVAYCPEGGTVQWFRHGGQLPQE
jgi:hypothetical protein